MGVDNKFISNKSSVLSTIDGLKNVQIGVVASIDDSQSLGRIKVKIPGPAVKGGDDGTLINDLPWSYPMIPKFFLSTPKVGEGVFILTFSDQKTHSDRLYLGPIISQLDKLNNDQVDATALSPFTFALINPDVDVNMIPALKGVFPSTDDVALQGRNNTDMIFRTGEVLIRAGKFITSIPNENNPYPFQFNNTSQGFLQIRSDVPLEKTNNTDPVNKGSFVNLVGNKINLLTHASGSPRFDLMNQDDQISDDEMLNILQNAHPLPFGDLLIQYLKLLKNAFLNHVHNNNGIPPTDLVSGGAKQDVKEFKKNAEDLENRILSKNIRIN